MNRADMNQNAPFLDVSEVLLILWVEDGVNIDFRYIDPVRPRFASFGRDWDYNSVNMTRFNLSRAVEQA